MTIHGDTVEPKLLPRNGPSGCDSHCWMSRADQSLTRPSPKICSAGVGDRDRLALAVAGSDPHRELQLVIELAARPEARRRLVGQLALAARPAHRHARLAHRGGAAVIGDRHVFVVRAERVVRVAPPAAIGGVVDAGEEIGEVADRRRQVQPAIAGAMKEPVGERLGLGPPGAVGGKQREDLLAQRAARRGAQRHQRVEAARRRPPRPRSRPAREQPGVVRRAQVENLVADRDAAARPRIRHGATGRAEHPEGQVLQRKLGVPVGRGDPALARAIMGFVDHADPSLPQPQYRHAPASRRCAAGAARKSRSRKPGR